MPLINSSKKSKLIWQCRRGMLELDLMLIPFAENQLDTMTEKQIAAFDKLLQRTDPELYSWLMGQTDPVDKELIEVVEFIKGNYQSK